MSNKALMTLHDLLLAERPDGAAHDDTTCPLCAGGEAEITDRTSGGYMPETFAQEDVDAAVAAATDPLQKRLAELEAQVQQSEVGKAVADAVADKDTQLAELQQKLDAAEAARTVAEAKVGETEQFWANAIEEAQRAAELAARRDERVAAARDVGVFNDDYIAENADRFAAMTEEDFAARIQEWRLIAASAGKPSTSTSIPATTALTASRAEESTVSPLSLITELRAKRVDPRTLVGGA